MIAARNGGCDSPGFEVAVTLLVTAVTTAL
jgi:hypothetical protein